jgi:hypothetical protein
VEVKGVVTSAPASGSDSFTATTFVVAPRSFAPLGGGSDRSRGDGYSYGGKVGGDYGYHPSSDRRHGDHGRGAHALSAHALPGSDSPTAGTPNTMVAADANTKITLNGQSASISNLTVGDMFVAIYNGTPSEALSAITATPATSVRAWTAPTGDSLYAFVGSVASTGSGTVSVNVTSSFPTGMFSGADTFTVGSQTKVLGNTNLTPGDIVAGGLIAPSGESATTVGSTPLQVLVDFAPPTASPSTAVTAEMTKRAEHRALEMLRHEKAKLDRRHDKFRIHTK